MVGRLDDGRHVVTHRQAEVIGGFVGDGRGDDDALAKIDPDAGGRLSFAKLDHLAVKLISRADLFHFPASFSSDRLGS